MNTQAVSTSTTRESVLGAHRVLRNTYALLALTILFSALTAGVSMALKLPHPGLLLTLAGYFGLLFAVSRLRNSGWGLVCVFALTGFMGLTLGPMLNAYLALPNGGQVVASALGGTGLCFLALSGYALASRRDFSFLGNFLFIGILAGFAVGIGAIVFGMPALALTVSALFVLLMSGLILYETGNIIHGGETNYIMATVTLYVTIFNLLTSLMHLLGAMGNQE
jgi:modulator of FtsH protease